MFYFKTESVDKFCVPFGVIIGPCTVFSNVIKLIGDIAKIAFNGLLTLNYKPSQAYTNFKIADLVWEQTVSPKHKPKINNTGYLEINSDSFTDPEYSKTITGALEKSALADGSTTYCVLLNWSTTYCALSSKDKRQLAFDQAKQDSIQHLTFIGVGIIRSIPLVGGIGRWVYNVAKAS